MRRAPRLLVPVALVALLAGACGGEDTDFVADGDGERNGAPSTTTSTSPAGEISVSAPAFGFEEEIPGRFSLAGENVSPELEWEVDVEDSVELVLLVDDPDAPTGDPFVHWMVAGLDPASSGIPEGTVPEGAVEGTTDFGRTGWGGPAPPEGENHRYFFRLVALSAPSGLAKGFSRADLAAVLDEHFLVSAEHVGRFGG